MVNNAERLPKPPGGPDTGIRWDDLTDEKIAAIPLLAAQREAARRASR